LDRPKLGDPAMRRIVRTRSWVTLALFAAATVVALFAPIVGMALIFFCLLLYIRPEPRLSALEN
jgi:chromate transport protein ChrA